MRATSKFTHDLRVNFARGHHHAKQVTNITNLPSHAYAALPLISQEEYLERFPQHAQLHEPELMPLRIEYEKSEREKLELERLALVKRKLELQKENGKRKEDLRKLDERLEKFLEGARGIEEVLNGMQF